MFQWLLDFIKSLIFGPSEAKGKAEQQTADAQETIREAENAAQVSKQVDAAGVDAAADDLASGMHSDSGGKQN
jgi:hypothetical protein